MPNFTFVSQSEQFGQKKGLNLLHYSIFKFDFGENMANDVGNKPNRNKKLGACWTQDKSLKSTQHKETKKAKNLCLSQSRNKTSGTEMGPGIQKPIKM